MFLTIPTIMTWTRIVAIPLIVGVYYLPMAQETRNLVATSMFVLFANHLGQVLSHERILAEVWGDRYDQATQYVWVHISHLRKKLLVSGATGVAIETVRSVGYRMHAVNTTAR